MTSIFNPNCFEKKRLVITGASSGIGKETTIHLSRLGASLILVGRDENRLNETRSQCKGQDHQILPIDFNQTDSIYETMLSTFSEKGPLHGVFHCAGLELIKPLRMLKLADIQNMMAVSVDSFFMIVKAATHRSVRADAMSIVGMSSVAGITGQTAMSAYSAVKGAMDSAAKSLAVELAPQHIRVNTVIAGAIQTPMHDRLTKNLPKESIDAYESKHLLGFGTPQDVANAVVFLLSDAAKWITGTQLIVDGGYTCQ